MEIEDWNRSTAVAGSFYPQSPNQLKRTLGRFLEPLVQPEKSVFGIIAPHAGYVYSGRIAGEVYRRIAVPDLVFVLCPNHTGFGKRLSVWSQGAWETPLGKTRVAEAVAKKLLDNLQIEGDRDAHTYEHAIEVQLPFLQTRNPRLEIVPITMAHLTPAECQVLGEAIHQTGPDALIVASTDMSHFISADEARVLDHRALKRFETIEPDSLYQTVEQESISMCGYIPTTTLLFAARVAGKQSAEVLSYGNSGESNQDFDSVVGYAAGWIH